MITHNSSETTEDNDEMPAENHRVRSNKDFAEIIPTGDYSGIPFREFHEDLVSQQRNYFTEGETKIFYFCTKHDILYFTRKKIYWPEDMVMIKKCCKEPFSSKKCYIIYIGFRVASHGRLLYKWNFIKRDGTLTEDRFNNASEI